MSPSDPERRDGGLPEHEEQAWDAIVADLSGQIDLGPQFPKERSIPAPIESTGWGFASDLPESVALAGVGVCLFWPRE